jgi:hypothetical protein
MQHEYDFLMDNGTWELVDLPAGRTVVNGMWIYKIKSDTYRDVSRYKDRFVAKGLDYTETFSLVIRMASLRLFLAIAAAMDIKLGQLDIDTYTPPIKRTCTSVSPWASLMAHLSYTTSDVVSTCSNSSPPPRL